MASAPLRKLSVVPPIAAFDSHHLNAVSRDDDGNFIISLRGSSTVYYIDRSTKKILWRLGGKKSNFQMGKG